MEELLSYLLYIINAISMANVFYYFIKTKNKILKRMACLIVIIIPSIMAASRGTTGTDSTMYRRVYEFGVDNVLRWQDFEGGFVVLIKLLNSCNLPYQALFFVMSFLTTTFTLMWIYREKNIINVKLAVFIYFMTLYLYSFNAMRQCVAIAICLLAIGLFLDNYKMLSICFIILAVQFHLSALIAFLVLGGKTVFESKRRKIYMFLVFGIAGYLIMHRELFAEIVKKVTGSGYYASYITRDAYTDGSIGGYFIKIFPVLIIAVLNFSNYKKSKRMYTYFGLMICGYILASLGSVTATQVGRMGDYFIYLNIVVLGFCSTQALPFPVQKGKQKVRFGSNVVTVVIGLYMLIYTSYNMLIRNFGEYLPYYGIFK